jgi:hypothetical protein
MSKRPIQILSVALLIAAAVWVLGSARNATSDEARYRQWLRPVGSWSRLVFLERRLPTCLSKAFHLRALERRYLDKNEKIEDALVTSGYLTNVAIAVSNAGSCRAQIASRLGRATHAKWEFSIHSNAVVVLTCRPQDVALCARAIESD